MASDSSGRLRFKPRKLTARDFLDVVPHNLLAAAGYFVFGWSVWETLLFYYIETAIIGLVHAVKLVISRPGFSRNSGNQRTPLSPIGASLFFLANYGFFTGIQFYFVWEYLELPELTGNDGVTFWLSIAGTLIAHVTVLIKSYIMPGLHHTTPVHHILFEPYGRIFVQQLFAIIGSFVLTISGGNPGAAIAAFTIIKTGAELLIATIWDQVLESVKKWEVPGEEGGEADDKNSPPGEDDQAAT